MSRCPHYPHAVTGEAFSEVAGSAVCDAGVDSYCSARIKGLSDFVALSPFDFTFIPVFILVSNIVVFRS